MTHARVLGGVACRLFESAAAGSLADRRPSDARAGVLLDDTEEWMDRGFDKQLSDLESSMMKRVHGSGEGHTTHGPGHRTVSGKSRVSRKSTYTRATSYSLPTLPQSSTTTDLAAVSAAPLPRVSTQIPGPGMRLPRKQFSSVSAPPDASNIREARLEIERSEVTTLLRAPVSAALRRRTSLSGRRLPGIREVESVDESVGDGGGAITPTEPSRALSPLSVGVRFASSLARFWVLLC